MEELRNRIKKLQETTGWPLYRLSSYLGIKDSVLRLFLDGKNLNKEGVKYLKKKLDEDIKDLIVRERLKDAMQKDNLFSIAYDIGLSESTLRKYIYGHHINILSVKRIYEFFGETIDESKLPKINLRSILKEPKKKQSQPQ